MPHDEFAESPMPGDARQDQPNDILESALTVDGSAEDEHPPHKCAQCAGEAPREAVTEANPTYRGQSMPLTSEPELASAVNMLAQVAMQMDDPVQALEDGVDALAEALVERQFAAQQQEHDGEAMRRREEAGLAELQNAYRHARLHRIGELIDVGYDLDRAIAITNANEAEMHQRSLAAGRDPRAVIYEYAVRHGYRPTQARSARRTEGKANPRPAMNHRQPTTMERLAGLSDEEFAQATAGDRWERLLKAG